MVRGCVRFLGGIAYTLAFFLVMVQGVLIVYDVFMFRDGSRTILEVVFGVGPPTLLNVMMTMWTYFSATAYSALWFCVGRGLWAMAEKSDASA